MTAILILIGVYLLSVFGMYWYIRLSYYHKNGQWKNLTKTFMGKEDNGFPNSVDYFVTFFPYVNTAIALFGWIFSFPIEFKNNYKLPNIFKPKDKK